MPDERCNPCLLTIHFLPNRPTAAPLPVSHPSTWEKNQKKKKKANQQLCRGRQSSPPSMFFFFLFVPFSTFPHSGSFFFFALVPLPDLTFYTPPLPPTSQNHKTTHISMTDPATSDHHTRSFSLGSNDHTERCKKKQNRLPRRPDRRFDRCVSAIT